MSIQPLTSLFPLIDDPANIFYSGLKSLYLSFIEAKTELVRISRCRYEVSLSYPNITGKISKSFDIRKFKDFQELSHEPVEGTPFFYMKLEINKVEVANTETTIVGEDIPVKEYKFTPVLEPDFSVLVFGSSIQDPEKILIEDDFSYIYFLVDKVLTTSHGFDLSDQESKEECYGSIYKPEIGRNWTIHRDGSWELYSIDADFDRVLIDSSAEYVNSSNFPSPQMAPYKETRPNLYINAEEIDAGTYSIDVIEKEYLEYRDYEEVNGKPSNKDYRKFTNIKVYYRSEEVLNSAHSYNNMLYLFSSIKIRYNKKFPWYWYKREHIILALSYITGLNIRFFLINKNITIQSQPAILDTYQGSPSKIEYSSFLPDYYLRQALVYSYPGVSGRDFIPVGTSYYLVPIMQNFLGFSPRTPIDRTYLYNRTFIEKVRKGMLFREDVTDSPTSSLALRNRVGTPLFENPGYKNMTVFIKNLGSIYGSIGDLFNNSYLGDES